MPLTESMDVHLYGKHVELEFSTTSCSPDGWGAVVRKGLSVQIRRVFETLCSVLVYNPQEGFQNVRGIFLQEISPV
jgi:hypothetical protein